MSECASESAAQRVGASWRRGAKRTGGGVIGGGAHEHVVAATLRFLGVVEEYLDAMPATDDVPLPVPGRVVLRALTYDG
jgi:hypothetical protein